MNCKKKIRKISYFTLGVSIILLDTISNKYIPTFSDQDMYILCNGLNQIVVNCHFRITRTIAPFTK